MVVLGVKNKNSHATWTLPVPPGGKGTPYSGLYGETPPERSTFVRVDVYKRVGISCVEI